MTTGGGEGQDLRTELEHARTELPLEFNEAVYDEKYGYRTSSMLVVPMLDHRDRVVGVLQLINRKRDPSAPSPTPIVGYSPTPSTR